MTYRLPVHEERLGILARHIGNDTGSRGVLQASGAFQRTRPSCCLHQAANTEGPAYDPPLSCTRCTGHSGCPGLYGALAMTLGVSPPMPHEDKMHARRVLCCATEASAQVSTNAESVMAIREEHTTPLRILHRTISTRSVVPMGMWVRFRDSPSTNSITSICATTTGVSSMCVSIIRWVRWRRHNRARIRRSSCTTPWRFLSAFVAIRSGSKDSLIKAVRLPQTWVSVRSCELVLSACYSPMHPVV